MISKSSLKSQIQNSQIVELWIFSHNRFLNVPYGSLWKCMLIAKCSLFCRILNSDTFHICDKAKSSQNLSLSSFFGRKKYILCFSFFIWCSYLGKLETFFNPESVLMEKVRRNLQEEVKCNFWSKWEEAGECSVTCGDGHQSRQSSHWFVISSICGMKWDWGDLIPMGILS